MKCFIIADMADLASVTANSVRGEVPPALEDALIRLVVGGHIEADESYDDYDGFAHHEVERQVQYDLKAENCIVCHDTLVGYYDQGVFAIGALDAAFRYPETYAQRVLWYAPKEIKAVEYGQEDGMDKKDIVFLQVPNGVTCLGSMDAYPNLFKLWLPASVKSITTDFTYNKRLCAVYFDGDENDWASIDFADQRANPSAVGASVYMKNQPLVHANLDVGKVGRYAFYGFTHLQTLHLSARAQAIEPFAFAACPALHTVDLPTGLAAIGSHAFAWCAALEKVALPEGITHLCDNLFMRSGLTAVDLPVTLRAIGESAFANCDRLQSVALPEGLAAIANDAFYSCSALREVRFSGNSLESLGEQAFAYCRSLVTINLNKGLRRIGSSCFAYCESLQALPLPAALQELGANAFYMCTALREVHIPSGQETYQDTGACYADLYVPHGIRHLYVWIMANVTIHYEGKLAEWQALDTEVKLKRFKATCRIVCADGELAVRK